MNTHNAITIQGPIERVFDFAAKVEDWPRILPHYRRVAVIREEPDGRLVEMRCVRAFGPFLWPCRWSARQQVRRGEWQILYEHQSGPVKGMTVVWELKPTEAGVLTTITHKLVHPFGRFYSQVLAGKIFVSPIADRTLRTIKSLIEAEVGR